MEFERTRGRPPKETGEQAYRSMILTCVELLNAFPECFTLEEARTARLLPFGYSAATMRLHRIRSELGVRLPYDSFDGRYNWTIKDAKLVRRLEEALLRAVDSE